MAPIFRARSSHIQCFFCQSSLAPQNTRSFRCPHCNCWNRYDEFGEILSDDPAMHDETLNHRSFAKRASPSKDRLPTTFGHGPFCRTCQTNQTLLVNLLSAYLPDQKNPEYEERLAKLPAYRDSLYSRYPPVCETCSPLVEDEIRKKDNMARTSALGGWLRQSRGKEQERRVSGQKPREDVSKELLAWKIRGVLWVLTLLIAVSGNAIVALDFRIPWDLSFIVPILPILAFASIFWTAWDPKYAKFRKSQLQGRDVRLRGKRQYNIFQMLSWSSRLTTALLLVLRCFYPNLTDLDFKFNPPSRNTRTYFTFSLFLELFVSLISLNVLKLQNPPRIRLIDTTSHQAEFSRASSAQPASKASTPAPDVDAFRSALSLNSAPVLPPPKPPQHKPIFGVPSLAPPPAPMPAEADSDEMDWTPTDPSGAVRKRTDTGSNLNPSSGGVDDGSWLRPQRFFAPEHPTGLEGLFERTRLVDELERPPQRKSLWSHVKAWYG